MEFGSRSGEPWSVPSKVGTILALGFLVGLIAFTLESGTIRHNTPDEGVAAFTQKPAVLSEAAKRMTPAQ